MNNEMSANRNYDNRRIRNMAATRFIFVFILWGSIMFLSAGTLFYWEAWVVLAVFSISTGSIGAYFLRHDPGLLERRMRYREKEREQKRIITFGSVFLLIVFLLPGFDKRYGWSEVPSGVVILADFLVVMGYVLFFWVINVNRYASRIVEVEEGQHVITTGPYALVRHPMYFATSLIFLSLPIALGSYWAFPPACLFPLILVARIKNEEKILLEQLKGYREYVSTVKHRLIPGLWVPV